MPTAAGAVVRTRDRAAAFLAATMLVAMPLAACSAGQPAVTAASPSELAGGNATSAPASADATDAPGSPSAGPATSRPTAVPRFAATMTVSGDVEIAYDWSASKCGTEVIPDLGAHAFRDAAGQTHLVLSWVKSYRMSGDSLDALVTECRAIGTSDHDARPGRFDDNEWIVAPYTLDGRTVYALVHNEYQGHTHDGRCPSGDYFTCWDNSITLAISTDGGAHFADAVSPPGHLIATPPVPYSATNGPSGYREPSNIIRGQDGFYYAYFQVSEPVTLRQWVCVMRTDDLAAPGSWRFRDGAGWSPFIDPYRADPGGSRVCPPLDQGDIGHALNSSITYNAALERYVLVGISADQIGGREVWGVYYAFSTDLLQWSRRQLLMEVPLPWTVGDAGHDLSYLYPTLLDPDSTSMNYETTDDEAYLYITRNNRGHASLDRDLVRFPVTFTIGT